MSLTHYAPRISGPDHFTVIVRVDPDGEEHVIHGYRGRHFSTRAAAEKSTHAHMVKHHLYTSTHAANRSRAVTVRTHARRLPAGQRTTVVRHTRNRADTRNRLEVGRTAFSSTHLKLHLFVGSLRVTELVHAGKRGKKVREFSVIARSHDDAKSGKMLGHLADAFVMNHSTYDEAKAYAEKVADPMATKIHLVKKFSDDSRGVYPAAVLTIDASPHDFMVNSRVSHSLKTGGHGHYQDTLYSSAGTRAVQRAGAQKFYAWLTGHLAEASHMNIADLREVWDRLGVQYDYH